MKFWDWKVCLSRKSSVEFSWKIGIFQSLTELPHLKPLLHNHILLDRRCQRKVFSVYLGCYSVTGLSHTYRENWKYLYIDRGSLSKDLVFLSNTISLQDSAQKIMHVIRLNYYSWWNKYLRISIVDGKKARFNSSIMIVRIANWISDFIFIDEASIIPKMQVLYLVSEMLHCNSRKERTCWISKGLPELKGAFNSRELRLLLFG